MIKLGGWFAATMLAVFWVASSAQATVVCVQPQGGVCRGNIFSAIFDLQFGDTVRVRPGVYRDTIQLPPLKAGMRIIGSAGVIIDARSDGLPQDQPPSCPNTRCQNSIYPDYTACAPIDTNVGSPTCNILCPSTVFPPKVCLDQDVGVHLYADDTQIVGLTILAPVSHGVLVEPGFLRSRLVNVRILRPNGEGIRAMASDGTQLVDVEVSGSLGGANLGGAGVIIDRLTIEGSDGPGLVIASDDVVLSATKISRVVNGRGIFITGDNAYIDRPDIENVSSTGIEVIGNAASVVGAKLDAVGGGIVVAGDSPFVSKNRIENVTGSSPGIFVTCATCTDGVVENNRVERTMGGSSGYAVTATGPGLLVQKNRAKDIADTGFDLTGSTDVTLLNNRAESVGAATGDCFVISGSNHIVEKNNASDCAGNGFTVMGANAQLENNTATGAAADGFEVAPAALGAQLTKNRAKSNGLYGVEVADGTPAALNTVLDSNTASQNTVADLCEEGQGTTLVGNNRFKTELFEPQDGVRDCVQ